MSNSRYADSEPQTNGKIDKDQLEQLRNTANSSRPSSSASAGPDEETIEAAKVDKLNSYFFSFPDKLPGSFILLGAIIMTIALSAKIATFSIETGDFAIILLGSGFLILAVSFIFHLCMFAGWNIKSHAGDRLYKAFRKNKGNFEIQKTNFLQHLSHLRGEQKNDLKQCLREIDNKTIATLRKEAIGSALLLGLSKNFILDIFIVLRSFHRILKQTTENYDRSFNLLLLFFSIRVFFVSGFINEFANFFEDAATECTATALGDFGARVLGFASGTIVSSYFAYKLLLSFALFAFVVNRPLPLDNEEATEYQEYFKGKLIDIKNAF